MLEIGTGEGRLLRVAAPPSRPRVARPQSKAVEADLGTAGDPALRSIFRVLHAARDPGAHLPKVHFHDASKLEFPAEHFDLVVSQVSFFYVEQKVEHSRKCGACSSRRCSRCLQFDSATSSLPPMLPREDASLRRDGRRDADTARPRLRRSRSRRVRAVVPAQSTPRRGRRVHYPLKMKKNRSGPLPLELAFDASRSRDLESLGANRDSGKSWFHGFQSVYRITAATRLGALEPSMRRLRRSPHAARFAAWLRQP